MSVVPHTSAVFLGGRGEFYGLALYVGEIDILLWGLGFLSGQDFVFEDILIPLLSFEQFLPPFGVGYESGRIGCLAIGLGFLKNDVSASRECLGTLNQNILSFVIQRSLLRIHVASIENVDGRVLFDFRFLTEVLNPRFALTLSCKHTCGEHVGIAHLVLRKIGDVLFGEELHRVAVFGAFADRFNGIPLTVFHFSLFPALLLYDVRTTRKPP